MKNREKEYQTYRSQLATIERQIDAWHIIANQKYHEGDETTQFVAYAEIDKLVEKKNSLVDPLQGQLVDGPTDLDLVFDS